MYTYMSIQMPMESVITFTNLCSLFLLEIQARGRRDLILVSGQETTVLVPVQSGLSEPLSATKAIFVLTQGISTQLKQWETNSAKVFERLTRLCHSLESLLEGHIVSMGQAWSKLTVKSFLQLLSLCQ